MLSPVMDERLFSCSRLYIFQVRYSFYLFRRDFLLGRWSLLNFILTFRDEFVVEIACDLLSFSLNLFSQHKILFPHINKLEALFVGKKTSLTHCVTHPADLLYSER